MKNVLFEERNTSLLGVVVRDDDDRRERERENEREKKKSKTVRLGGRICAVRRESKKKKFPNRFFLLRRFQNRHHACFRAHALTMRSNNNSNDNNVLLFAR